MIIDIQHTEEGDIDLSADDILFTASTRQHQRDLLLADKGYYKENPGIGVGALNYLNENNPEHFFRSIRREFTNDGMTVTKVSMDHTDAYYEEN